MRPALCRAVIILIAAEMSVIIGSNIVISPPFFWGSILWENRILPIMVTIRIMHDHRYERSGNN